MRIKKLSNLIKELKHAQDYHKKRAKDLSLSKKDQEEDEKIIKQKDEIIKAITGKELVKKEHFKIVKRWRKTHLEWIEYLSRQHILKLEDRLSKKEIKELTRDDAESGTINHHLRWLRNYTWTLYYLEKKRLKNNKKEFDERLWK